jgi:hypothetical protein
MSGLHGDVPQADLRYGVAEPDEAIPKVVMDKRLVDGDGEIHEANDGDEDGAGHLALNPPRLAFMSE